MDLVLIRHGQVEAAQGDQFYGGIEVPLSDLGREQARAAARFLRGLRPNGLWCSPLARARFGAECVAQELGLAAPQVLPELCEIDRGRWVGLSKSEVLGAFPGDLEAHEADPHEWRGHGGESLGDLASRINAVWDDFERRPAGLHVVVSHLFPTRCLIGRAVGLEVQQWRELKIPTGSVSYLRRRDAGWERVFAGHEPGEAGFSEVSSRGFPTTES
ncbi:MAG: histidine phosphatase family protein [Planctomycetes bacterium]|nr:histidine phosphatase family protein [Planctomycetota bacterium]